MKKAKELKKGDSIVIAGKIWQVLETEISDVGKQGARKVRIIAQLGTEKITLVRPEDYPFETK